MAAWVEFARLLLITVFSIKAGEAATGKQLLPQNPFDILQWKAILSNYDVVAIAVVAGVFAFMLLLLIILKKKRQNYERVIYIAPPHHYYKR